MKLFQLLKSNNIELSDQKTILVEKYTDLLLETNKRINLISRKDEHSIFENHIIPCLLFSKYAEKYTGYFLDIGTGGGLPGIIYKIYNSESMGTLVDSIQKKINAIKDFIIELELKGISAECTRVEDKKFIQKNKNSFDVIISRATANLSDLISYSKPLIKKSDNSVLLCMKGGDLEKELDEAKRKFTKIIINQYPLIYYPSNAKNENLKFIIEVKYLNDI